jgi:hypothetical protein
LLGLSPEVLVEEFTKRLSAVADDKSTTLNALTPAKDYKGIFAAIGAKPALCSKFVSSLIEVLISIEVRVVKEIKKDKDGASSAGNQ